MYFRILNFLSLALFSSVKSYDTNQLNICVWLSGAAYCKKENYSAMKLGGPAKGFEYKDLLYDKTTDLQGFTGVLSSTKSIYVVLRGSSSSKNWIEDFEARKVHYDSFPDCKCEVHNGFYKSALSIANETIKSVTTLQKKYPGFQVIVSGHSYGASCAQLLAMELERNNIQTKIYNYGQPRIGDSKYACFVNQKIPEHYRTTHNKDIVPHIPPNDIIDYLHSCREIFEDKTGTIKVCSEYDCEDPKCSAQYKLRETNGDDHSIYLGHHLSCEASTI